MNITRLNGLGGPSSFYGAAKVSSEQRQNTVGATAIFADTVTISPAARDLFATQSASSSAPSVAPTAVFDTDQGRVEINIDEYFSPPAAGSNAELPPLLMPTQENIDALSKHLSAVFPKFLADNGIPYAPPSISYNNEGQPEFPADYPYGEPLKKALQDTPSMAKEIATTYALADTKAALDDAMTFQQEYRQASSQNAVQSVIAKYADLLAGSNRSSLIAMGFTPDGQISIAAAGQTLS
jgi:hypothetical protein